MAADKGMFCEMRTLDMSDELRGDSRDLLEVLN
jgi:hypothetical protein